MPKTRIFPSGQKPTQQDIKDYLDGLNRTEQGSILTRDSERLGAIAIANYQKWFKHFGIPIYQDAKHIWCLGHDPNEETTVSDDDTSTE